MSFYRWLAAIAVAGNQLANAVTGGSPDESISSRLGHAREHGSKFGRFGCAVLQKVNPGDKTIGDHCDEAMSTHTIRMQTELEKQ